jgi:DNA repair exonuclease SbcCD ATPase subunit
MMRTISKALFFALLLGGATTLRASAQDELRDKARAIQKEAASLAERGQTQTAERLTKEAQGLVREAERREAQARQEAPRPEIEQAIGHLKERLQDLLVKQKKLDEAKASERDRAEVREQIAGTERELNAVRERLAGGRQPRPEFEAQVRQIEEAARRIHHIRVAAENLKAAGIHDLAMKLTEQAEKMEREIGEAKERLAREMDRPGGPDPRDAEIRELRQQNERLQAQIRDLRQKLEKR